jgi:aminopeptidase
VFIQVIRNIFRVNLGVRNTERVLVFNDRVGEKEEASPPEREQRARLRCISLLALEVGAPLCKEMLYLEYTATGSHGAEPPEELWNLAFGKKSVGGLKRAGLFRDILGKKAGDADIEKARAIVGKHKEEAVDCVIGLSNYSTSHTRFRDLLCGVCGCRYASMPMFDLSMVEGAMNVDWKGLKRRTELVSRIVDPAEWIEIETPNGTGISFSKKGRKVYSDTGILTAKGAFGNLPAGEAFLAPVEGTAQGKLILEWGPTAHVAAPVTLTVKEGIVTKISGKDKLAGHLEAKLSERRENGNIAELGIGTNPAARRPDNILESEKILGTVHIALGDNSSFGGTVKTPYHQDFVFFRPSVTLVHKDGARKQLLRNGRLLL